ncbi:DUF6087 family protein [Streptomyces sp. PTM05]|uniref:DUF6087 family protein n=1 Tax=Streptantibioticus parmotrematis TaxID=2873249 RepID=A0ABS7QNP5_9ACTN|nr:DUF6087 family protein [Streptantibioticus parmotrematis]MBY8884801.1 DUF6087 family protein [Streptantibioticus parmotrematis]
MGKHNRPRVTPGVDPADPLAPYLARRQPPDGRVRIHEPVGGGARHVRPGERRWLKRWDGFAYVPAGIADNLKAAQEWVRENSPDSD